LLVILILCLLANLNYRLGGRSFLYPPVIFCVIWAVNLLQIWILGDFFYPLSTPTLFVVVVCAFTLSAGSWLALIPAQAPAGERLRADSNRLLNLLFWTVILSVPFYVRWMVGLVREYGSSTFLGSARGATTEEANQGLAYSFFFNLVTLSLIVA